MPSAPARCFRVFLAALALLQLAACGGVQRAGEAAPGDLAAALSGGVAQAPQREFDRRWMEVTARFAEQRREPAASCGDPAACPAARWETLVAELRALPPRQRVIRANAALNQLPYVAAATNWGDPSHWETPYEFLARGGQCEDYAIAKYLALAAAGTPESDLRFVVVRDERSGLDHAIAIATVDGEDLVLDNQTKDAVPAAGLRRYQPYYAWSGASLWIFGRFRDGAAAQQIAGFPASPYADAKFQLAHY